MESHFDLLPELHPARTIVERWARPATWFAVDEPGMGRLGQSRVGGTPDLPESVRWPTRVSAEGQTRHLDYLLQVDLADLAPRTPPGLPPAGMLWLFEEWNSPDDRDQLIVYTGEEPLMRTVRPQDDQYYVDEVIAHTLTFREGFDLPRWASDADDAFRTEVAAALHPAEPQPDDGLLDEIDALLQQQTRLLANRAFGRFFGYAGGIGHSIHDDAAVHRLDPTALYDWARRQEMDLDSSRWRNLLTVESDLDIGLVIGDAGYTVVLIHDDDLAASDFSKVFISNESS